MIPPVILVTAYGREEIMQKAEAAGLEGFLIKPVNPSVMFDTIVQIFGREDSALERAVDDHHDRAALPQELVGATILLVEDNPINQQVAMELLSGAGFQVTLAANGREAVDAVRIRVYDAVLMDVQMPVLDGFAATREIREWEAGMGHPGKPPVPIIAMTAHAMAGDRDKSIAAGMNDHIAKPVDPDLLYRILARWVRPRPIASEGDSPPAPPPGPEAEAVETDGTAAAPLLPDVLPGFDTADGLHRLRGNAVLYRKLLVDFGLDHRQTSSALDNALGARDFEAARSLVHAIKGVAGNLGAKRLQSAAAALEKRVAAAGPQDPDPGGVEREAAAFRGALEEVLESTHGLAEGAGDAPGSPAPECFEKLPAELAEEASRLLREAAETGDVSGVAAVADDLASRTEAFAACRDRIAQLLDEFDFDGILALADRLNRSSFSGKGG